MRRQVPKFTGYDFEAYISGRLDEETRSRMEVYLAANPEMEVRILQDCELKDRLRKMFEPVLAESIPDSILEILHRSQLKIRPDQQ